MDLAIVEWGVRQTASEDLMHLSIGVHSPAGQLLQGSALVHVAELIGPVFSWLNLQFIEMYGTLIDANRRPRLHPGCRYPMTGNALREVGHSGLRNATPSHHLSANVHQSVEESACCQNHALRLEFCAPDSPDADGFAVFNQQFIGLILPDVKVWCGVKMPAPLPDELASVALGPW